MYNIPRKSEKSTGSRKGVAVVFLSWRFSLALGPALRRFQYLEGSGVGRGLRPAPRRAALLRVIPGAPGPDGPPNLIQSVSPVDLLVFLLILLVNLPIVWDWIACDLLALFVIFFHAIILPGLPIFFGLRPVEELQGSGSSPRREEVGGSF